MFAHQSAADPSLDLSQSPSPILNTMECPQMDTAPTVGTPVSRQGKEPGAAGVSYSRRRWGLKPCATGGQVTAVHFHKIC